MIKFNEIMENYKKELEFVDHRAINTIKAYERDINQFINYVASKECTLEDIKNIKVLDYNNYAVYLECEKNNLISTKNRKLASIKSFFGFLNRIYGVENIIENIKAVKNKKDATPLFLENDEAKELFKATIYTKKPTRNKLLLDIFLYCGLRVEEVENLSLANFNFEDNSLNVIGKGSKSRIIKLNPIIENDLNVYLKELEDKGIKLNMNDRLFQLSKRSIQRSIKRMLKIIGKEEYSCHKLRHTFATELISNNVDIKTIQELLGHVNINTTQIYVHSNDSRKQNAVNSLSF